MSTRRTRCGQCAGCTAGECRKCKHCLDMKKNGGPGNLRRPCVDRVCRAIQAAPTKKSIEDELKRARISAYRGRKGGEEQQGGGLEGQLAAERARAEAARRVKAPPPPRVLEGHRFDLKDVMRVTKALGATMATNGQFDWDACARKLSSEEPERVKEVQESLEASRLEDEGVPAGIVPDWVPEARKVKEAQMTAGRWTPARCRALWRWGAYGLDESCGAVLDLTDSDDELVKAKVESLMVACGAGAPGAPLHRDTYLGLADPASGRPRELLPSDREYESDDEVMTIVRPVKPPAPPVAAPKTPADGAKVNADAWILRALHKHGGEDYGAIAADPAFAELVRGRDADQLESAMATWLCYGKR